MLWPQREETWTNYHHWRYLEYEMRENQYHVNKPFLAFRTRYTNFKIDNKLVWARFEDCKVLTEIIKPWAKILGAGTNYSNLKQMTSVNEPSNMHSFCV